MPLFNHENYMKCRSMKVFLCSLFLTCSTLLPLQAARATAVEIAPAGEIINLKTGQRLTALQLLEQLSASSRLIVGEKHDNPYHHQIELWLTRQLAGQRPQGAVLLEMLSPDQQKKVDSVKTWLQGKPVVRAERISSLIAWQASWDWEMYGELAISLMQSPYPLWSANLSKAEVTAIYQQQTGTRGVYASQPAVIAKIEQVIREMHDGQIETAQLLSMVAIQQQRDRRMAERLLAAPAPALLIAGGYHAAKDMGVPVHMQDLASAEPTVLMLAEQGAEISHQHADYLWLTRPAPAMD